VAFHFEIARIVGNPLFVGLHQALLGWLTEQRNVSLRRQAADRKAYNFHRRIFDAIAAHDQDAVQAAMETHLDDVAASYWRIRNRNGQ
jgi:GntR family transcriptional repressor for pyruvate dehydrogenase complex